MPVWGLYGWFFQPFHQQSVRVVGAHHPTLQNRCFGGHFDIGITPYCIKVKGHHMVFRSHSRSDARRIALLVVWPLVAGNAGSLGRVRRAVSEEELPSCCSRDQNRTPYSLSTVQYYAIYSLNLGEKVYRDARHFLCAREPGGGPKKSVEKQTHERLDLLVQ